MKLLKLSAKGLSLFKDQIEIDFFAEQKVMSENNDMLFNQFGRIFSNNVISIVGVNAAGKTSLLKVISFALALLNGESINNIGTREILNNSKNIFFELIFLDGDALYRMETNIVQESDDIDNRYIINSETLFSLSTSKIRSKKDLTAYNLYDVYLVRDNKAEFLKDDISVVISVNKNIGFKVRDLINLTNLNLLGMVGEFPRELIDFLDPSIKNFAYDKERDEFILEFFERDIVRISSHLQLDKYLSSGTIKGINIFLNAFLVFENGGYLIVDELENHFNKEIAATLVRFFMNKSVNRKGATLIFTTHYSELLDEIERCDNIYVVRNRCGITAQKLSHILKRSDIKKSEVFKSGYLEGTVPAYESYINLKTAIVRGIFSEA